jgi:hypothetical protein
MQSLAVSLRYRGVISGPSVGDLTSTQVDAVPDYLAVTRKMGHPRKKKRAARCPPMRDIPAETP